MLFFLFKYEICEMLSWHNFSTFMATQLYLNQAKIFLVCRRFNLISHKIIKLVPVIIKAKCVGIMFLCEVAQFLLYTVGFDSWLIGGGKGVWSIHLTLVHRSASHADRKVALHAALVLWYWCHCLRKTTLTNWFCVLHKLLYCETIHFSSLFAAKKEDKEYTHKKKIYVY